MLKRAIFTSISSLALAALIFAAVIIIRTSNTDTGAAREIKQVTHPSEPGSGLHLMMQNEYLAFYMDHATTHFIVKDLSSGSEYHSNPVDWQTNPGVNEATLINELGAVFSLTYYNPESNSYAMNSYRDSILLGMFTINEPDTDASVMSVDYTVGPDKSLGILPRALTEETYTEYILGAESLTDDEIAELGRSYRLLNRTIVGNLRSETDKERMYERYPNLDDIPVYELRTNTSNNTRAILTEIIEKTALTIDIIAADLQIISPSDEEATRPTFHVNIEYRLEGANLVVKYSQDGYYSDLDGFTLSNVQLLRYFGAFGPGESGEIFVPDGSGAIIKTERDRNDNNVNILVNLYGGEQIRDYEMDANISGVITSTAILPVFGISSPDGGLFAIIESADAVAQVLAETVSLPSPYNNISASFNIWPRDLLSLGETVSAVPVAPAQLFARNPISCDIVLRYAFLQPGASGYVDMAKYYRGYLEDAGKITRLPSVQAYPLQIEFLGGVVKRQSFLGIMIDRMLPLTKYSEVGQITERLLSDGVAGLSVRYNAWSNKGYANTFHKGLKLIGSLGGRDEFNKLSQYLSGAGVGFYPDINLLHVGSTSLFDNFSPNRHAARTIVQKATQIPAFHLIQGSRQRVRFNRYLVSPVYVGPMLERNLRDAAKIGIDSFSLGGYGRMVLADYRRRNELNRADGLEIAKTNLASVSAGGTGLMMEGVIAPFLPYTDFIVGIPLADSMYKIMDYRVPFVQIVLHGYVDYAGEALNTVENMELQLLLSAEGGAALAYTWIAADNGVMINTELDEIYTNLYYENMYANVVAEYQRFNTVFSGLHTQLIENHIIFDKNLVMTEYENGGRVYVNYGITQAEADGFIIPARDFVYVDGSGGM